MYFIIINTRYIKIVIKKSNSNNNNFNDMNGIIDDLLPIDHENDAEENQFYI